jgi:hypothetical protein
VKRDVGCNDCMLHAGVLQNPVVDVVPQLDLVYIPYVYVVCLTCAIKFGTK